MIRIFKKTEKQRLCVGLTLKEFRCRCEHDSCRCTIISSELIEKYERLRIYLGSTLKINSGYRCNRHNLDVGGVAMSRHQTGEAIDISLDTLGYLSHNQLEKAIKLAGFTYCKFYNSFIHIDCRSL